MQFNKDNIMMGEKDNALSYFTYHKEEKYLLGNKKQGIEEDQRDLVGEIFNAENRKSILSRHTL